MPWCLAALTVPLALVALGLGSRGGFSAPLTQPAVSEGAASLERVDLRRSADNPFKHCFKRKEARSCRGVGTAKSGAAARLPHPAALPGQSAGPAASSGTLHLPSGLPSGAGSDRTNVKRQVEPRSAKSQADTGLKFTGGMGVPTNRAALEGALSPYQQPNGNTSASTSGKPTNGIEEQGMHFGFEWRY